MRKPCKECDALVEHEKSYYCQRRSPVRDERSGFAFWPVLDGECDLQFGCCDFVQKEDKK